MARWSIITHEDGQRSVRYQNLWKGTTFDCGRNRADTPVGMLIDWCAIEAEPGDWIVFDGEILFVKFSVAQA